MCEHSSFFFFFFLHLERDYDAPQMENICLFWGMNPSSIIKMNHALQEILALMIDVVYVLVW